MSEAPARRYEPIAVSPRARSSPSTSRTRPSPRDYQSEAASSSASSSQRLKAQAYEYLPSRPRRSWSRTCARSWRSSTASRSPTTSGGGSSPSASPVRQRHGIVDKTRAHPGGPRPGPQARRRVDKNIKLIDKNPHPQQPPPGHQPVRGRPGRRRGARSNRYDVTILVNGLPLVHVELKRRGVDIREAFNQINRYQRDSFWAGSGLFDYVQLFVISNGTLTKYYSNTTRRQHLNEARAGAKYGKKTSNSFEFTSWWADAQNRPIQDLTGSPRRSSPSTRCSTS
jgi:type I restriction enzyme R subunit